MRGASCTHNNLITRRLVLPLIPGPHIVAQHFTLVPLTIGVGIQPWFLSPRHRLVAPQELVVGNGDRRPGDAKTIIRAGIDDTGVHTSGGSSAGNSLSRFFSRDTAAQDPVLATAASPGSCLARVLHPATMRQSQAKWQPKVVPEHSGLANRIRRAVFILPVGILVGICFFVIQGNSNAECTAPVWRAC